MSRIRILILLPLLSLACSVVLYEPAGSGRIGTELPNPSTTATIAPAIEWATVCNIKAEFGLNLRSGAGTYNPVLMVLRNGTHVQVVESRVVEDGGTWKRVVEGSGKTGWVNSRYLCEPKTINRSQDAR